MSFTLAGKLWTNFSTLSTKNVFRLLAISFDLVMLTQFTNKELGELSTPPPLTALTADHNFLLSPLGILNNSLAHSLFSSFCFLRTSLFITLYSVVSDFIRPNKCQHP